MSGVKAIYTEAFETSDGKAHLSLDEAHDWEKKLLLDADGNAVETEQLYWTEVLINNSMTWIQLRVKVTGSLEIRVSRWHGSPRELIEPCRLHRYHPNGWRNDGPTPSRSTEAEELRRLSSRANPIPM